MSTPLYIMYFTERYYSNENTVWEFINYMLDENNENYGLSLRNVDKFFVAESSWPPLFGLIDMMLGLFLAVAPSWYLTLV